MPPTPPPLLREFGESRISFEVRRTTAVLLSEMPGELLALRFYDRMRDPLVSADVLLGFWNGFLTGAGTRLRAWRDDLQATLTALLGFLSAEARLELGIATGVSLYEFLRGPFEPKAPSGLSPASIDRLEQLKLMHGLAAPLAMLDAIDSIVKAQGLLETVGMAAEDIAIVVLKKGSFWVRAFLLAEPNPQGEMLGKVMGAAFIELARMIIEPPELSLVELAGMLNMGQDEASTLATPL
jgi:hypothetical protein